MASSLPSWMQWVQVLGPVAIAIIALVITSWIQIRLHRLSREKLKLDLLEKRAEVYAAITDTFFEYQIHADISREVFARLVAANQTAKFLFSPQIASLVSHFVDAVFEIDGLERRSKRPGLTQGQQGPIFEKLDIQVARLREIRNAIDAEIVPAIRIEVPR